MTGSRDGGGDWDRDGRDSGTYPADALDDTTLPREPAITRRVRLDGGFATGGTGRSTSHRPSYSPSAMFGRVVVTGVLLLTVVFLIAPVLITFVASFATEWTGLVPTGFVTLDNWKQALGLADSMGASRGLGSMIVDLAVVRFEVPAALAFSLGLAMAGMIVNLLVGVPIAYAVSRYDFVGRDALNAVAVLPVVPGIILGVAFLRTYPNISATSVTLIIGYSLLKAPYMVLAVQSSFESMDLRQLEESARSLGASWPRAMLSVVLPNAKRGIISGSIICWTLAAAEFNFSYIVYSRGARPFSLFLFENISNNPFLRAAAAVSIYFLIVTVVTVALRAVGQRGFSVGGVR